LCTASFNRPGARHIPLPRGAGPRARALAAAYDVAALSIQEPDIEDVIREL